MVEKYNIILYSGTVIFSATEFPIIPISDHSRISDFGRFGELCCLQKKKKKKKNCGFADSVIRGQRLSLSPEFGIHSGIPNNSEFGIRNSGISEFIPNSK